MDSAAVWLSAQPTGCALSGPRGPRYLGAFPRPRAEPEVAEGGRAPDPADARIRPRHAVVMFGIGVSRVFGLVREQVVAFYFGRSAAYSAFVAAYKVPNLVRVLLGEGNLSASFIPVLAGEMAAGDEAGTRGSRAGCWASCWPRWPSSRWPGWPPLPRLAWLVAPGFDPELR